PLWAASTDQANIAKVSPPGRWMSPEASSNAATGKLPTRRVIALRPVQIALRYGFGRNRYQKGKLPKYNAKPEINRKMMRRGGVTDSESSSSHALVPSMNGAETKQAIRKSRRSPEWLRRRSLAN